MRDIYGTESLLSRERQLQHKFKQSLLEAVEESLRQIANFDSPQANVSRAN